MTQAIYIKPVRYLLTHHRAQTLRALDVGQSDKAARKYLGMYTSTQLQYLCKLFDRAQELKDKLKQAEEAA